MNGVPLRKKKNLSMNTSNIFDPPPPPKNDFLVCVKNGLVGGVNSACVSVLSAHPIKLQRYQWLSPQLWWLSAALLAFFDSLSFWIVPALNFRNMRKPNLGKNPQVEKKHGWKHQTEKKVTWIKQPVTRYDEFLSKGDLEISSRSYKSTQLAHGMKLYERCLA